MREATEKIPHEIEDDLPAQILETGIIARVATAEGADQVLVHIVAIVEAAPAVMIGVGAEEVTVEIIGREIISMIGKMREGEVITVETEILIDRMNTEREITLEGREICYSRLEKLSNYYVDK